MRKPSTLPRLDSRISRTTVYIEHLSELKTKSKMEAEPELKQDGKRMESKEKQRTH
ncbi:hypothetical protein F2Q68_00032320 [Brassica cretica]|uniref:Uncharacterized protein n=1 Tax=Brassica cretica TaxID=69181 RepID=A0A8S9G7Y6_BRACR|nr:hypothetical protein F2Q68_00032320 [Brassica cretica]